jgi:hypothetical protein
MVSRPHSRPFYLAHARTAGPLWPKYHTAKSLAAGGWLQAVTVRPASDASVSAVGEFVGREKANGAGIEPAPLAFRSIWSRLQRARQITHEAFGDGGVPSPPHAECIGAL